MSLKRISNKITLFLQIQSVMSLFTKSGSLDLTSVSEGNQVKGEPSDWKDHPEELDEHSRLNRDDAAKPDKYEEVELDQEEEAEGVSWAKLKFAVDDEVRQN